MKRRSGVVVVGSLHYDVMVRAPHLPRIGETLMGDAWWWKPGGKGGNQAMAASRHGAATHMIGRLGDDGFGARLRESLLGAGVGVEHVRTVPRASGMSVAIEQADGDYAAVVVSGANLDIDATQIEAAAGAIEDSAVLILQNEIDTAANVAAAAIARRSGATVVLNAAPMRPLPELHGLFDILIVNAVEAEMLGANAVTDLASASSAADRLTDLASIAIVTAGAAGVAISAGGETWTVAGHHVDRAETHGAGDVFVGALASRLAGADDLRPSLDYANAAAALHVSTPESKRSAIGPDDVQRWLADRTR